VLEQQRFCLHVEIPEAIPAELVLPNGEKLIVTGGVHDFMFFDKKQRPLQPNTAEVVFFFQLN
jgi:hypothetical protein